jgi:hypothetical protein
VLGAPRRVGPQASNQTLPLFSPGAGRAPLTRLAYCGRWRTFCLTAAVIHSRLSAVHRPAR